MKDILDFFFQNKQVNTSTTMVRGNDLCKMLGLFHDLAEVTVERNLEKIAELEKYKVGYNIFMRKQQQKREQNQKDGLNKEDLQELKQLREENAEY